jgi:hypothetical protein
MNLNWNDGSEDYNKIWRLKKENEALRAAAKLALHEMVNTVAPRDSFTDAVDALDAALRIVEGETP